MQTGRDRAAALQDVPTAVESGFADFEALAWWGVFAPKGTPPAIIQRANAAFIDTLKQEDVSRQLREASRSASCWTARSSSASSSPARSRSGARVVRDNNISAPAEPYARRETMSDTEDQAVVRAFRLDTATISDALDHLGIPGQCHRIAPRSPSFRLTGRAFTVLFRPAECRSGTVGDYIDDVIPAHRRTDLARAREDGAW